MAVCHLLCWAVTRAHMQLQLERSAGHCRLPLLCLADLTGVLQPISHQTLDQQVRGQDCKRYQGLHSSITAAAPGLSKAVRSCGCLCSGNRRRGQPARQAIALTEAGTHHLPHHLLVNVALPMPLPA